MEEIRKINGYEFFGQWAGHPIRDLKTIRDFALRYRRDDPIVYLAGDSSLDNKFWVPESGPDGESLDVPVPEIYQQLFERGFPKPDVAFWMNHVMGSNATCINAAIEASMLRQRDSKLLPQDEFIHDSIRKEDVLVVSVGANDIALKPAISTIWHMLRLAWLTRYSSITSGTAWSLPYFANLFGPKIQDYVGRLCAKTKPRAVIICMIYYPLEAQYGQLGWADLPLKLLGYNRDPKQLQATIRKIFEMGTMQIQIDGSEVVPCKLYEILDGKQEDDYTARVEPSSAGGRRMAEMFKILVNEILARQETRG